MDGVRPLLRQANRSAGCGPATRPRIPGVGRVALVRDDRLGDFLVALPALAALQDTYRGATFALVVSQRIAPLARLVPGVERVIVASPARGAKAFALDLRAFGPDLLVCVSRGWRAPWAAWRAGIPHRVGPGRIVHSPLFTRRVGAGERAGAAHEVDRGLAAARAAGADAPEPARFPLLLPQALQACAAAWLETARVRAPFAILHPGGGGSCPRWPAGHFRALADELATRGIDVVVSTGPDDRAVAAVAARARGGAGAALPVFEGDLPALAALVRRSSVLVGSSTGPVHLAAALGVPVLALHAPWASCGAERWAPYSPAGWALVAWNEDALTWSRRVRELRAERLMAALAPEAVAQIAVALLEGRDPSAADAATAAALSGPGGPRRSAAGAPRARGNPHRR